MYAFDTLNIKEYVVSITVVCTQNIQHIDVIHRHNTNFDDEI
jgi:hypothetical protein